MNNKSRDYRPPLPYPRGITKWLMKLPILLYRFGLGTLIGEHILILTTTGRKSGKPRLTAIEHRRFREVHYIFSAWGLRADWFRNIRKNPHVHVWAGRRQFEGMAEVLDEAEKRKALQVLLSRFNLRVIHRLLGIKVEPTAQGIPELSERVTIVRLKQL